MKYKALKQTSTISNKTVTFLKAMLVGTETLTIDKMAKLLAAEGSTVSETDIVAVIKLLSKRLPQLMSMGYAFNLPGLGELRPSVRGSLTEEAWRESRIKALMAEDSTLTEAAAKTKQASEEFDKSKLTSKMITAHYYIKKDADFETSLQTENEWQRVTTGEVDEQSDDTTSTDTGGNEGMSEEV